MSYGEIRDDVPLPPAQSSRSVRVAKSLEELEVGQSFIWPDDGRNESALRSACHRYGKKWGRIFACRRVDNDTFGVWRTE